MRKVGERWGGARGGREGKRVFFALPSGPRTNRLRDGSGLISLVSDFLGGAQKGEKEVEVKDQILNEGKQLQEKVGFSHNTSTARKSALLKRHQHSPKRIPSMVCWNLTAPVVCPAERGCTGPDGQDGGGDGRVGLRDQYQPEEADGADEQHQRGRCRCAD